MFDLGDMNRLLGADQLLSAGQRYDAESRVLKRLLRIISVLAALIDALLVIAVAALWWTNRDIPMAELEARYGGEDLPATIQSGWTS